MYAIFKDGGHQYKAEVGKKMYLELRDVEPGTPIELTEVLAISKDGEVKVGQPTVPGAKIIAEAPTKEKSPKLVVRLFCRRKNSRKKTGAVKRTSRSKSKKSSKAEFNSSVRACFRAKNGEVGKNFPCFSVFLCRRRARKLSPKRRRKKRARNSLFVGSVAARTAAKRRAPSNGRQGQNFPPTLKRVGGKRERSSREISTCVEFGVISSFPV